MRPNTRLTILAVVLGIGAAILGFGVNYWLRQPTLALPTQVTEFELADLAGKKYHLADYHGKVVLLNFWATWCPPCRKEIPLFIDMQRRYQGQGLQIVGIAVDNAQAVASYQQEMHINYPLLLADDGTEALMAAYGNQSASLPYSVLIGVDGKIAGTRLGAYHADELEKALNALLPAAKPASP